MKITTLFICLVSLLFVSDCKAFLGEKGPIQEIVQCKPFGKNGAHIANLSITSKATYHDVVFSGDQTVHAKAASIEVLAGKNKIVNLSAPMLEGTAANSPKGIYYDLHPVGNSNIDDITIATATIGSGKGASAVMLKNDQTFYSMDCKYQDSPKH